MVGEVGTGAGTGVSGGGAIVTGAVCTAPAAGVATAASTIIVIAAARCALLFLLDTAASYRYQPELVLNEDARAPNRCAALAANAQPPNFESLMTFPNLPQPLAEALSARGYAAPTPVQAAVIEPDAQGRDLIVSAQTGSGKTVAFGLAMAGELMPEGALPPAAAPLALIIAPTRELALQVSRELIWLYGPTGARIATCVGGMDASRERRALNHGAHVVVGTPGRLRDHLERGALRLSSLRAPWTTLSVDTPDLRATSDI